jgi:hypothetical protein
VQGKTLLFNCRSIFGFKLERILSYSIFDIWSTDVLIKQGMSGSPVFVGRNLVYGVLIGFIQKDSKMFVLT